MNKIRRTVNIHPPISLHNPERSDMSAKVNRQTWAERYAAIVSEAGYNNGRRIIKAISVSDWQKKYKSNAATWFIDAGFLHYSLTDSGLFVDFAKLKADFIQPPINYFTLYFSRNEGIFRLFTLLQQEGYYLINKEIPSVLDPEALRNMTTEDMIRTIERRATLNTIIPEMIVRILTLAWDDDIKPEMNHVLIFSQNYQLIPAIQQLRRMDIVTSLAITSNRANGNYYLQQFDNLVPMHDLFTACGALSRRNFRASTERETVDTIDENNGNDEE